MAKDLGISVLLDFYGDMLTEKQKKTYDTLGKVGTSYGLGVFTTVDAEKYGFRLPTGEFGWDGAAGAYLIIDPENEVSVMYAQHEFGAPWHHTEIRDAVYAGLRK